METNSFSHHKTRVRLWFHVVLETRLLNSLVVSPTRAFYSLFKKKSQKTSVILFFLSSPPLTHPTTSRLSAVGFLEAWLCWVSGHRHGWRPCNSHQCLRNDREQTRGNHSNLLRPLPGCSARAGMSVFLPSPAWLDVAGDPGSKTRRSKVEMVGGWGRMSLLSEVSGCRTPCRYIEWHRGMETEWDLQITGISLNLLFYFSSSRPRLHPHDKKKKLIKSFWLQFSFPVLLGAFFSGLLSRLEHPTRQN